MYFAACPVINSVCFPQTGFCCCSAHTHTHTQRYAVDCGLHTDFLERLVAGFFPSDTTLTRLFTALRTTTFSSRTLRHSWRNFAEKLIHFSSPSTINQSFRLRQAILRRTADDVCADDLADAAIVGLQFWKPCSWSIVSRRTLESVCVGPNFRRYGLASDELCGLSTPPPLPHHPLTFLLRCCGNQSFVTAHSAV